MSENTTICLTSVHGQAVLPYVTDLARLRIEVFREFPYLYDGDMTYEEHYLRHFAACEESIFVLARTEQGTVVGVSTALPLRAADPCLQEPFVASPAWDPERIFYCGESVLLPAYRGQGIGVRFFEAREQFARTLVPGYDHIVFCAVDRPSTHPRRPADYVSLDAFWQRRGYTRHPELCARLSWRDLDETTESRKPMIYWVAALAPPTRNR